MRDDVAKKTYEYEVNIDSTKSMQYGLLKSDILKQINIALKGYSSSVYRKNGSDYDILVKTNISSVVVPVVYSLVNTKLEEKPIKIDKLNIKSKIDKLNFKSLVFWKK